MSEISELMASNDPMATPVVSLGPPPPQIHPESSPQEQASVLREKYTEQLPPVQNTSQQKSAKSTSKLTADQKLTVIVGICTFIVLLPNVQQLLTTQLPILTSNSTLHVVMNSVLVSLVFATMRDHFGEFI